MPSGQAFFYDLLEIARLFPNKKAGITNRFFLPHIGREGQTANTGGKRPTPDGIGKLFEIPYGKSYFKI